MTNDSTSQERRDNDTRLGSTDPNTERLQRAAREMINAARSFLDIAEEFVNDPSKVADAATTVSGLVAEGLKLGSDLINPGHHPHQGPTVRQQPDNWADDPLASDPLLDEDPEYSDDPYFGDYPENKPPQELDDERVAKKAPTKKAPAKKRPAKKRATTKPSPTGSSSSKVRRIPLDDT